MRLKDRVAIVTGGSRGIGRAICLRLASEGAKVVVNYFSGADTGEFAGAANQVVQMIAREGNEALAFDADVARKDCVDAMVKATLDRFSRIDILVNNAGIVSLAEFLNMPEELWDRVHDVNLKGVFLCSQAVAKAMVEQKVKGRIINISSVSSIRAHEYQSHYCSTKAAVNLFTQSIALALGRYGITCNCVLPGLIETDATREALTPEAKDYLGKQIPVGRIGQPEDIAGAVAFLASDEAAFITGAILVVDGGGTLRLAPAPPPQD